MLMSKPDDNNFARKSRNSGERAIRRQKTKLDRTEVHRQRESNCFDCPLSIFQYNSRPEEKERRDL